MAMMNVGTSRHGDSLPAELRVDDELRGTPYFGLARLGIGLLGLTAPRGMNGLGQCNPTQDDYDPAACAAESAPVSVSPTMVGPLAPNETYGPPPSGYTCPMDDSGNCTAPATSIASVVAAAGVPSTVPGYSGPTIVTGNGATPTPPAGYEWATLANQAGQTIAKVLAISQGGSAVTLPNGSQLIYGSAASSANAGSILTSSGLTATLGSMGPLLLIGAALFLLFSMERK